MNWPINQINSFLRNPPYACPGNEEKVYIQKLILKIQRFLPDFSDSSLELIELETLLFNTFKEAFISPTSPLPNYYFRKGKRPIPPYLLHRIIIHPDRPWIRKVAGTFCHLDAGQNNRPIRISRVAVNVMNLTRHIDYDFVLHNQAPIYRYPAGNSYKHQRPSLQKCTRPLIRSIR